MTKHSHPYSIKAAAERSGLSANAIRDYEKLGLLRSKRGENGYRYYNEGHINRLQFIRRARAADFSLAQISELLGQRDDPNRDNRDVKVLIGNHLKEIRSKIKELQQAEATLTQLYMDCLGDGSAYCAIIDGLDGIKDIGT